MPEQAKVIVGRFTFDPSTQMIEGPGEYMADQGSALMDKITSGNDAVFNMTAHMSPSPIVAVLVRMQTDYAGWIGSRQLINMVFGKKGGAA